MTVAGSVVGLFIVGYYTVYKSIKHSCERGGFWKGIHHHNSVQLSLLSGWTVAHFRFMLCACGVVVVVVVVVVCCYRGG